MIQVSNNGICNILVDDQKLLIKHFKQFPIVTLIEESDLCLGFCLIDRGEYQDKWLIFSRMNQLIRVPMTSRPKFVKYPRDLKGIRELEAKLNMKLWTHQRQYQLWTSICDSKLTQIFF